MENSEMNILFEQGYLFHSTKLGEGGFGIVKLATHKLTQQKVAIKIIDKDKTKKDLFRVKNEITALKLLRHKNIAKLLQVFESDRYIYLVMEYCNGGELFDYIIARSRISERESRQLVRSLVMVLSFIHSKGFAHRDIKPENIMLDSNKNIKLIDFGLSASVYLNGRLDGLSTCCGSPAYVAPELLMGNPYSGPPADVWSTGVLLYALLTGRLPFHNDKIAVLYKSIKEGKYTELPNTLSIHVRDLISRMLCVDPKKRITLQEIMEHRWMNLGKLEDKWTKSKILANEVLKDDESELDEKILLKCLALFPNMSLENLRYNIQNELGYHAATYWIVKQKPELFKEFDPIVHKTNRRRSRSFSTLTSYSPKKVKNDVEDPRIIENINNEKKSTDKMVKMPPEIKMKPVAQTEVKNRLRKQHAPNIEVKSTPANTMKKSSVNKKLFNDSGDHDTRNLSNEQNPMIPFFDTPSGKNQSKTPKKSIFKVLLETATPKKTAPQPRRFTANSNSMKNVIMTNHKNVNDCILKILNILQSQNISCQTKNYMLRCSITTHGIIVAFELELMVCRRTGMVGIQPKRIRGLAWDYIKICEDLKAKLLA